MSELERCTALLNTFTDAQLVNVAAMLRVMRKTYDDLEENTPNAETIAAAQEVNEMIRTGSGHHFKGSAADLFAMLDAEGEEDA